MFGLSLRLLQAILRDSRSTHGSTVRSNSSTQRVPAKRKNRSKTPWIAKTPRLKRGCPPTFLGPSQRGYGSHHDSGCRTGPSSDDAPSLRYPVPRLVLGGFRHRLTRSLFSIAIPTECICIFICRTVHLVFPFSYSTNHDPSWCLADGLCSRQTAAHLPCFAAQFEREVASRTMFGSIPAARFPFCVLTVELLRVQWMNGHRMD